MVKTNKDSKKVKEIESQSMATITLGNEVYDFPIIIGKENEKAIDIRSLRIKTGYITLDPGFANTGSCISDITYIDGEKGILRSKQSCLIITI